MNEKEKREYLASVGRLVKQGLADGFLNEYAAKRALAGAKEISEQPPMSLEEFLEQTRRLKEQSRTRNER